MGMWEEYGSPLKAAPDEAPIVSQTAKPQDARSNNDPTSFLRNHLIFSG